MSLKTEEILTTFVEAIDKSKAGTRPYDTSAEVVRTEGKTVWVHIPSGVDETPIKKTIDCRAGDIVQIRVSGGTAWIVGNSTAPPTDDRMAIQATINSAKAELSAKQALGMANESNSNLTTFITVTYSTDKIDLQSQIDGKAETWYQSSDPSTAWTTTALKTQHKGDLWYNTSNDTTWYWSGTAWQQQNIPTAVFDKIDGKAQIFTSQPTTPYSVGDLWFNSNTSDIMVCTTSRASGNYTASDWEKRDKYTDDATAIDAGGKAEDAQKDIDATNEIVTGISGNVSDLSTTLNAYITSNNEAITNLSSDIDNTEGILSERIGTAQQQVDALNASLNSYDGFIEIKDGNDPSITLGKRNDSNVKTKVEITGASVNLWTEDRITAYASGQVFRAPEGSFENISMATQDGVGNLMWIARSNGHLSLKVVN